VKRQDRPRGTSLDLRPTACIGVTTRGVRGVTRYARGARPATAPGADVRALAILTIAPCFAERSHYGTRTPNRLTTLHERRLDDVRLGPRQGSDLPIIGDVSARSLPRLPNACPARFPDTVSTKTSRRSPLVLTTTGGTSE